MSGPACQAWNRLGLRVAQALSPELGRVRAALDKYRDPLVALHDGYFSQIFGQKFDGPMEGDLGVPTTFLVTSFYWENFISSRQDAPLGHGRSGRL